MKSFKQYLGESRALKGLADEARKYDSVEDFHKAFTLQIKHGNYYHITDDPNFKIDSTRGPRDMSSMAGGKETPGKLMITSHLEHWHEEYPDRKYAALVDMSKVSPADYYQVNRGFGNEFMVQNPTNARVVKVMSIKQALRHSARFSSVLNNHVRSMEGLKAFYDKVHVKAHKRDGYEVHDYTRSRPTE